MYIVPQGQQLRCPKAAEHTNNNLEGATNILEGTTIILNGTTLMLEWRTFQLQLPLSVAVTTFSFLFYFVPNFVLLLLPPTPPQTTTVTTIKTVLVRFIHSQGGNTDLCTHEAQQGSLLLQTSLVHPTALPPCELMNHTKTGIFCWWFYWR